MLCATKCDLRSDEEFLQRYPTRLVDQSQAVALCKKLALAGTVELSSLNGTGLEAFEELVVKTINNSESRAKSKKKSGLLGSLRHFLGL